MLHVQDDVGGVTASIQAAPVVLRDAASFQSYDLPGLIRMSIACVPPERHSDTSLAFVSDDHGSFVTRSPIFQIQYGRLSFFKNDPYDIDSARLNQLLDRFQPREGEAITLDLVVIVALLDHGTVVQCQTVIVLDRGVPLVCQFDLAIAKGVDLIRLQHLVKFCGRFVEASCLDEGAFPIDKVNIQKLSLTSRIFPVADVSFLDDTRLDYPVSAELVKSLDWHVGVCRNDFARPWHHHRR